MRHTLHALVCAAVSTVASAAFWPFSLSGDDAEVASVNQTVTSNGVTKARFGSLYRDNLVVTDVDMSKIRNGITNIVAGSNIIIDEPFPGTKRVSAVGGGGGSVDWGGVTNVAVGLISNTVPSWALSSVPNVTNGLATASYVDSATNAVFSVVTNKADRATTLIAYGITNAYTKAETESKIGELAKLPGNYQAVSNAAMTAHSDATNYTDAAIRASISDSVSDASSDKALSARQGSFLYELVTDVSDRENDTWLTVSDYLPYLEKMATNNYKAALIANKRATNLELWRKDTTNDLNTYAAQLATLQSVKLDKSDVVAASPDAADGKSAEAKTARGLDDLNVYEKVGVGDDWVWTSEDADLLGALKAEGIKPQRIDDDDLEYHMWYIPSSFGHWFVDGGFDTRHSATSPVAEFKLSDPQAGKYEVIATATRAHEFRLITGESLAKVSQLVDKIGKDGGTVGYFSDDFSQLHNGLDLLKFQVDWGYEKTFREILSGFVSKSTQEHPVDETMWGKLDAIGGVYAPSWGSFSAGDPSAPTLPDYLASGDWNNARDKFVKVSQISETNEAFAVAVRAVVDAMGSFRAYDRGRDRWYRLQVVDGTLEIVPESETEE